MPEPEHRPGATKPTSPLGWSLMMTVSTASVDPWGPPQPTALRTLTVLHAGSPIDTKNVTALNSETTCDRTCTTPLLSTSIASRAALLMRCQSVSRVAVPQVDDVPQIRTMPSPPMSAGPISSKPLGTRLQPSSVG